MTPKTYPQSLHTPKNIHFPKKFKLKILNPNSPMVQADVYMK